MAEEITNEAIVEESPLQEAPLTEPQVESESIETATPPDDDRAKRLNGIYKLLDGDESYSKYVPKTYDEFINKIGSDGKYARAVHELVAGDDVYSKYLPSTFEETVQYFGLGKPSAVPSPSVSGGSATKGRGVEEPSTSPQLSSEASLDNIQKTLQVYADGQGAFPETLSAADVKELRKQVPGGELPNISDEKVAKMLAGKSPKQVRIASVNAIPDIKERKTEQARMYKDFAREKSVENQQLDQNITALTQGLQQIKAEGENLQQQLQNPNIDPQTASMLSEQLQQTQANYNQAASDYNSELEKYQQNARFIKTMGAGVQSNLKGLIPSTIINPRSPSDVMAASAWNATAPALLKTLGAVIDVLPSPLPTDRNVVSDAIFNLADKVSVDVAKYSPQANVSLMDDVNVYNTSQLLGNLLGSVAMTFGGGAAAGATGAQAAGFSQVYGDVYKQGRDAGLTKAESMFFAMPTGIVAAYLGDKGVESLAGAFTKTSLKSAIKQGMKEMAEKKTPQMMMEFGKKVLLNTLEGAGKEGAQEGLEFATEFGSKKLASLKEDVKFKDDLSLEGFGKGLAESAIAGAAGGGLLGPFFGAGRNKAFADVVNKAARDPEAEIDFMEQLDASVVANDITPEQKQQMVEMLEKTKQAAATVPPVVESEPARAEATALVLEQQDLEQQIEQTNPAMAKPLNDRLDEVNNRLGEIAEGKNLPTEEEAPVSEAATEQAPQEKGEFSIQGTFDGLKQVLGNPANMIPDIVRADIEPKFSESNQNGKKVFTLTVPQPDDAGRAGYLAVSLVLPETTTKTIDDVKSALEEKVAEAQTAVKLSREKGFPLETIFKNRVSGEYTEQATPTTEPQAPVAEEAKGDIEARRKEELNEVDPQSGELLKENSISQRVLKEREGVNNFIDATKGLDLDKDIDKISKKLIGDRSYSELPSDIQELLWEGKTEEALEKIGKTYEEEVNAKYDALKKPTSEQTPQAFPAQEGAESVEDKFQANAELEQIYRDLNAAVTKNVDKDTIRMLKANPTEAMVDKALRELQSKGVIKIDCN
jgi:hypothetical protein